MPQFNGKQGAPPHRGMANLRCPRNGKRTNFAKKFRSIIEATGRVAETDAPGKAMELPASPDTGQQGGGASARRASMTPTVLAGKPVRVFACFVSIMKNFLPKPRGAALSLALAAAFPCAFAQASLEQVVVTASRTGQRLQDALPATTLITRADIDRAQTPDLPSLLRQVSGIEVSQNGGPGTVSGTFIRGAESRHTLVLVDGVPVNNLNFSLPALEHLALADIDHIEIVRGNVSALYGSAALGGVIQIFTRDAGRTPQASVTVQAGSRGLVDVAASGSVKLASGTGLHASVEGLRDKGFNATKQEERPATNPDRDGYRRLSSSVAITQDLAAGNSLGLKLRDAHGTTRYDSEFGPATQADESDFAERGVAFEGRFKLGSDVRLSAALTSSSDKLDAHVTAYPYFIKSWSQGAQLGLEWQAAPGQKVTAGVEHAREHLDSDTVYAKAARTQDSARLGYTGDFGRHQLQLGLRQDRYTDFGSPSTWLAGYAFRITDAWRVSAMASTGFNAPTFNDLYYSYGGNPLLHPERLKSTELGLQYAAHGHEVRATLFDNRFSDLIGNDAFFNRVNIGRARNRGVELGYSGRIGDTGVRADITSQDPVDLTTNTRLARRAATLAHLALTRDVGAWQFGGNARYSGSRPDGTHALGSYVVVDLTASYAVSPQVRLFGRLDNVTDRDYETVYGYRQAGRGAFVGVSWQPKL
jgi:vitamin B12 transporter